MLKLFKGGKKELTRDQLIAAISDHIHVLPTDGDRLILGFGYTETFYSPFERGIDLHSDYAGVLERARGEFIRHLVQLYDEFEHLKKEVGEQNDE